MGTWDGKAVLVTGASAGFGWALARAFAAAGARVGLVARDPARLQLAVDRLREAGTDAIALPADVTEPEQVRVMLDGAIAHFGGLDVLVNGAGGSTRGEVLATTADEFRRAWELNFLSAVHCTAVAASHLVDRRGHLVNIGSLASKTATRYLGAYPAAKFSLAAYSQQLRYELNPLGVHVLLVCPGPIARADAGRRYDERAAGLPESAKRPGAGVKLKGLDPDRLAARVLDRCVRRRPELIVPGRVRILLALAALSPALGDWIIRRMT